MLRVMEEIFADAYAGINAFGAHAEQLQEIVRPWVQENMLPQARKQANGTRQTNGPNAEVRYSYVGKNEDGIKVYETSDAVKELSWKERKKQFLALMRNQYRGRTAKFVRNGHTYYAKFEYRDVSKNIYGDNSSDEKGKDAKISVGADGNIFELVENARYLKSEHEQGKTQRMHRGVNYWDYFVKTVQIDGVVFDLMANVRKKSEGEYVYLIELTENTEIEPSLPRGSQNSGRNGIPNSSINSIQLPNENVNSTPENKLVDSGNTANSTKTDYRFSVDDMDEEEIAERQAQGTDKLAPTQRELERERQAWLQKEYNDKQKKPENKPVIAKQRLVKSLFDTFSIPTEARDEIKTVIENFADRMQRKGGVNQEDLRDLFDRLYASGVMTVEADEYSSYARSMIAKGRIYVNDSIKAEFGDDWADFRKRYHFILIQNRKTCTAPVRAVQVFTI